MSFNIEIWKKVGLSAKKPVAWQCGKCFIGQLNLQGSLTKKTKFRSIKCKCTHCGEIYTAFGELSALSGLSRVSLSYQFADDLEIRPSQIRPVLNLFKIDQTIPELARENITRSFDHFWNDYNATINCIRKALECIISEKEGTGNSLHPQINSLRNTLGNELTDQLLALKEIGNEGSHLDDGTEFTRDQVLTTYHLLKETLDQLYPKEKTNSTDELVSKINQNKGIKKL